MYITIIMTILGLSIGLFIAENFFNIEKSILKAIGRILLGGFISGAFGFSCVFGIDFYKPTYVSDTTFKLEALSDNPTVEGKSHFLGCGYIKGSMSYVWYKNLDGVYTMEVTPYTNADVVYTTGKPRVVRYKAQMDENDNNHWLIPPSDALMEKKYPYRYRFYVPKGTINNNYTLDAK